MSTPKEATPVTFTVEQTALGDWVWTLRCGHGQVDSMEVARTFSDDLIKGAFLHWAIEMPPEISAALVAEVAMRSMLGRLAEMRFGCPCGLQAFRLIELPGAGAGGQQC